MSLYETLGVEPEATTDEIKSAYRNLAKENHPDKTMHDGIDTTAKFQEIQRAYDVLKNPERRAKYDSGVDMGGPDLSRDERIDNDARENLLRMIEEIIRDSDEGVLVYEDILAKVSDCIVASKDQLGDEKRKQYRVGKKARIATRRLKTDNPAVKHHLRTLRTRAWQQYQQFKYLIAVGDRMDQMLESMEYDVDERPPAPPQNLYLRQSHFF